MLIAYSQRFSKLAKCVKKKGSAYDYRFKIVFVNLKSSEIMKIHSYALMKMKRADDFLVKKI